jgi:hypothetical protein
MVGVAIGLFRGLLGVHACYSLSARGATHWRPLSSKASAVKLPRLPLRLLPAGAIPCRVGMAPTEDRRLFTAHNPTL